MRFTVLRGFAVLAAGSVLIAACSSGSSKPASSTTTNRQAAPTTSAAPAPEYYVSIGDSYAAGYQPTGKGKGATTRNGFAYQVVTDAKSKGHNLQLANFGCAGATTASVLKEKGCPADFLGPGATPYTDTQAAAAEAFLKTHAGHVALITISIGGNDITGCGAQANPTSCVATTLPKVKANIATLLTGLRAAAGTSVPIVGITYPDVLLADYLSSDANTKSLASLSVLAFKSLINPTLQAVYAGAGAKFADVTAATGAYDSMSATQTVPGFGTLPVPVAKICTLTYMCQYEDIHPRTAGYALIANLVVGLAFQAK